MDDKKGAAVISHRYFDQGIKSVLHFDYPYYMEEGDGLADEAGLFTWSRAGDAKLAGHEPPADVIDSVHIPRFGYRCLKCESAAQYISGQASPGITFADTIYADLWVRGLSNAIAGTVFALTDPSGAEILSLRTDSGGALYVYLKGKTFGALSAGLKTDAWLFVQIRADLKTGKIDTFNYGSGTVDPAGSCSVTSIQIGGFRGYVDEFRLSDKYLPPDWTTNAEAHPYSANISMQDIGGFGDGELGDVIPRSGIMSSAATLAHLLFTKSLMLENMRTGLFGEIKAGSEVMIHKPDTGHYWFGRVARVQNLLGGTVYSLEDDLPQDAIYEINAATQDGAKAQVIQVPHFKTLTVNSNVTLTPLTWDANSHTGGIMAFRTSGRCTVNGKLLSMGYGRPRSDSVLMSHSLLIDQFITGRGGGIFIACGGRFTSSASARIGADWSGSNGAGSAVRAQAGGGGGSGYGGAGGSDAENGGLGGSGGVGGAGGGGDFGPAGSAGETNTTGGYGYYASANFRTQGGTQGKNAGGNAPDTSTDYASTGGGGAGGQGGSNTVRGLTGGWGGANLILLANQLAADPASISTGGQGGRIGGGIASGGGGTGFCYIAAASFA